MSKILVKWLTVEWKDKKEILSTKDSELKVKLNMGAILNCYSFKSF